MNLNSKLSLLSLVFAVTLQLRAQEQVFPNLNFAITPPENWKAITNNTGRRGILVVVYGAPERGRVLMVSIDSSQIPNGPMNDKFTRAFDDEVEKRGGKRISGKLIEMDGVEAYEQISDRLFSGQRASVIMHAVLTSERFYHIEGITLHNAADDPDIKKAMASFRFLKPAHPPSASHQSAAYRAGYIMGKYGMIAAAIGIALFFGISAILKSRRPKPPPLPPMG
jgi:hypothetical protein